MKNKKLNLILRITAAFALISFMLVSCKKDPVVNDPIASFQYEVSSDNYLEVTFTNYSQNATSYSWNFGDSETSTEANPVHTFAATGSYTVTLTATNADGASHVYSEDITIADPEEAYKLLTGEVSKTWKLYRVGTSMSLGSGPDNPGSIWSGLQNDGARPCLYNHEFTFSFDGSFEFDDKGWFWAEYGVFNNVAGCEVNVTPEGCIEATQGNMINACGDDVSAWLSNDTHSFTYDVSAGTATLTGLGAWIGICKLGTTGETTVPLSSTTFNLEITQETGYDLMKVYYDYGTAYWEIWYVNYSDPL